MQIKNFFDNQIANYCTNFCFNNSKWCVVCNAVNRVNSLKLTFPKIGCGNLYMSNSKSEWASIFLINAWFKEVCFETKLSLFLNKTGLGIYIVGLAHGVLFVLYVILLLQVAFLHRWNLLKLFFGFIASLVPFGTFYADKKLFR